MTQKFLLADFYISIIRGGGRGFTKNRGAELDKYCHLFLLDKLEHSQKINTIQYSNKQFLGSAEIVADGRDTKNV